MAKPKDLIQASTAFERVVHWVLGGSCLFLFLTGFGLMFHSLSFIAKLFPPIPYLAGQGYESMKLLHNLCGLLYEKRIADLEKELAARGEENCALIRAKIQLTRRQLEAERAQHRLVLN